MVKEKNIEKDIYAIINALVRETLKAAKHNVTDPYQIAIENITKTTNSFSKEQYKKLYHCVHWRLTSLEDPYLLYNPSWQEKEATWSLKNPYLDITQDLCDRLTSEIMQEYNLLLKCKYTGAKTLEEYKALLCKNPRSKD